VSASKRILVLPAAAAVIAALCAWKLSRPVEHRVLVPPPLMTALPSRLEFDLFDQQKPPQRVRLRAYVGRQPVVIVFFDAKAGANADPLLVRLRRDVDAVESQGVVVLGVSTALPQENRPLADNDPRKTAEDSDRTPFPFPLLTDLPPECRVHRLWGRYDAAAQRPVAGVFLIDRAGQIAWNKDRDLPQPLEQPMQVLDELLGTD
jgi:peroxiredoxin